MYVYVGSKQKISSLVATMPVWSGGWGIWGRRGGKWPWDWSVSPPPSIHHSSRASPPSWPTGPHNGMLGDWWTPLFPPLPDIDKPLKREPQSLFTLSFSTLLITRRTGSTQRVTSGNQGGGCRGRRRSIFENNPLTNTGRAQVTEQIFIVCQQPTKAQTGSGLCADRR